MAKPANKRQDNTHSSHTRSPLGGGSTFLGILIGLVLGLFIALGLAWYINKLPNPFKEKAPAAPPKAEAPTTKVPMTAEPAPRPAPKPAEARPTAEPTATDTPTKGESEPAAERPEVDKVEKVEKVEKADRADRADKKSTAAAKETFYIQTGSFQSVAEAESLKARLALLGLEASIQMRNLPDRGIWHRVRVGPYSDVEELNRIREVLKQNGIDAALVKVRETDK
jgi:cell division protein FtsN